MDELARALGPAFAAGSRCRGCSSWWIPVVDALVSGNAKAQKVVLSQVSLGAGIALAGWASLRVLEPLGIANETADVVVTGLSITGGTEGFNSVMKFLGYKKGGTEG